MGTLNLEKLIELTKQAWEYGPLTFRVFGGLSLALWAIWDFWIKWPILILGIIAYIWGEIWNKEREKHVLAQSNKIEEEEKKIIELTDELGNYQYSIRNIVEIFIISIYEALELKTDSRISLYLHDGNAFYLIARYSDNEKFKKFSKRVVYPADQGCIAKAWELGQYQKDDMPDPQVECGEYLDLLLKEFNIPADVAENFVMKSRSLVGVRLNDSRTKQNLAIVIIESIRQKAFDLTIIEQIKNFTVWKSMCSFLEVNKNLLPKPSDASMKGF
ncbi:MAG TPA: hypothetical protein PKD67_11930 [Ignavibacteriaceae bacterium]|nr:hypothetical protein [Ignavibacteriaceae bacterium]